MQIKTPIDLRQIALFSIAFVIVAVLAGAKEIPNTTLIISVTDASGAAIRGAHITLLRDETTTEIKVDADENGCAKINVKRGSYRLSVASQGFNSSHRQIELRDAASHNIEVKLSVGSCPPGVCLTVTREPWPDALEPASPPLDSLWVDASVPLAYCRADPCVNPETPGQLWLDQLMPISPLMDSVWLEEQ